MPISRRYVCLECAGSEAEPGTCKVCPGEMLFDSQADDVQSMMMDLDEKARDVIERRYLMLFCGIGTVLGIVLTFGMHAMIYAGGHYIVPTGIGGIIMYVGPLAACVGAGYYLAESATAKHFEPRFEAWVADNFLSELEQ